MLANIKKNAVEIGLFIILVASIWIPRGFALDRYATPDENLWLIRSRNFFAALASREFGDTHQVDHPGVTTMWVGAFAYLNKFHTSDETVLASNDDIELNPFISTEGLNISRQYMVFFNTIVLVVAFLVSKNLFGQFPALFGFLLISFDPFHIAHTRLLHLDGLLSNLMLLSLVSLIAFFTGGKRWRYLIISAVAASLSWLTKSPGLFLLPFATLFWINLLAKKQGDSDNSDSQRLNHLSLDSFAFWAALALFTSFALWPAMWGNALETIQSVVERAIFYADEGHLHPLFFNGEIFEDGKIGIEYFYFYPLTYIWRTTPVSTIGILLAVFFAAKKRGLFADQKIRQAAFWLGLFALLFTIFMTLGSKKFDRYVLPIYAPLDLISGLGWFSFANIAVGRKPGDWLKKNGVSLLIAALIIQLSSAVITFPYYLNYYNPLLGGIHKAKEVMLIGWGEGLDEAARYLNAKPNANELIVRSWYADEIFSLFFNFDAKNFNDDNMDELWASDYAVIYFHQLQRQLPPETLRLLFEYDPEYIVRIGGFDYVYIYNLGALSLEED